MIENAKRHPAASPAPPIDPEWAWSAWAPDSEHPWDLRQASHLLRRAGFGASRELLERALGEGPGPTIERMIGARADAGATAYEEEQGRYEAAAAKAGSAEAYTGWWLRRMITTPDPLRERLTLFLHERFALGLEEAKTLPRLAGRISLLRRHALGELPALLTELARDPATLVGLGAQKCRKARPPERLARVFLERYTVGEGAFTSGDVREVARAFTGRAVLLSGYRFLEREHDDGPKRILGERAPFDGDSAVRLLARRRESAVSFAGGLYRLFVREEDPAPALLAPLADQLAGGGKIAPVVERVLRSNLFFSRRTWRQRVKSPLELAVGAARALEGNPSATRLAADLSGLGQDLLQPPTIHGWPRGRGWLDRASALRRARLVAALLGEAGGYDSPLEALEAARRHGASTRADVRRFLVEALLDGELEEGVQREVLALAAPRDGDGTADAKRSARRTALALLVLPESWLA